MQDTYDNWRARGFQVLLGEKATGRNGKGQPTFSREQVVERYYEPADHEYEDDWMFEHEHHYGWGDD